MIINIQDNYKVELMVLEDQLKAHKIILDNIKEFKHYTKTNRHITNKINKILKENNLSLSAYLDDDYTYSCYINILCRNRSIQGSKHWIYAKTFDKRSIWLKPEFDYDTFKKEVEGNIKNLENYKKILTENKNNIEDIKTKYKELKKQIDVFNQSLDPISKENYYIG
jgi:CII-binding regulator of phage lambda lysogenization HflD